MQAFPAYLQDHLDRRDWKRADLARASGINESQLTRWISGSAVPNIGNARQLADTFNRPLLEVLLAAGILTADEISETVTIADLGALSNEELLREVDRRMVEAPRPAVQGGRRAPSPSPSAPSTSATRSTTPRPEPSASTRPPTRPRRCCPC